jgi:hypothetical protein
MRVLLGAMSACGLEQLLAAKSGQKRLADGNLPGYFAWIVWGLYVRFGYELGGSVNVKRVKNTGSSGYEILGEFSPKGSVSGNFELSGFWCATDDFAKNPEAHYSDWKFEKSIKYLLSWLDLKAGVGIKLSMRGGFSLSIAADWKPDGKGVLKREISWKPGANIDFDAKVDLPLYCTAFNLFAVNYPAIHFGLLRATNSGLAAAYDGVWVGDRQVVRSSGLRHNWASEVRLRDAADFERTVEICLGENACLYACCSGINETNKDQVCASLAFEEAGAKTVDWFDTVVSKNVELLHSRVRTQAADFTHRVVCTVKSEPSSSVPGILKLIAEEERQVHGRIVYNRDSNRVATTLDSRKTQRIVVKRPHVRGFSMTGEGKLTARSSVTVLFSICDFAMAQHPAYLWLYEADVTSTDLCPYIRNAEQCFVCPQHSLNGTRAVYRCELNLGNFEIDPWGDGVLRLRLRERVYTIRPKVSLDAKGEAPLLFDTGSGFERWHPEYKVAVV